MANGFSENELSLIFVVCHSDQSYHFVESLTVLKMTLAGALITRDLVISTVVGCTAI